MFTVIPFEPEHYVEIAIGQQNWSCVDPLEAGKLYKSRGVAISGLYNDKLVICAGIAMPWKGLGEMWAIFSPDAPRCHLSINKAARKFVWGMINEAKLRRVQASVDLTFTKGLRWVEWLGFKFDGISEKYGPNGEDFVRYVIFPEGV
jgi:hypothetical protein